MNAHTERHTGRDTGGDDGRVRARMHADVDAPDKVLYGLTFRQLAILAVAGAGFYLGWHILHTLIPVPVLLGVAVIGGGLVFGLAVGRRDGLALDLWLLAAIRHTRTPKALSGNHDYDTEALPDWVVAPAKTRTVLPAPLRLPADAVDDDGGIRLGDTGAAMLATTNINLALRTTEEQAALVHSFGRWLNSLSTPTQIVVSAQPVDLASHARQLATRAQVLAHPALRGACADHARFLAELAVHRDPLRRQVLIVTRAGAGENSHGARRRADDTVRSLSGLGVTARTLNGTAVTAALAGAADPYRPTHPAGVADPDTVITTHLRRSRR